MKKSAIITAICFCVSALALFAQKPVPGKKQTKSILVKNVVLHVGNGTLIANGAVGFSNGLITEVTDLSRPALQQETYDTVIDGNGKHLYPGFILTNSTIGLREVDAVRATLDYAEVGLIKPEVRAITSYNADSRIIPTVRLNGVLIAQSTPRGGLIPGQSSVVQLDAWNWEDAAISMEAGMHILWPSRNVEIYPWEKNRTVNDAWQDRNKHIDRIKEMVSYTLMYMNENKHEDYNGRCAAMMGLLDGTKKLFLHVNTEKDIMESVAYFEGVGIKNIVLVGAEEAYKIPDFIRDHHLSVILDRVHSLPSADDDDIKLPFKMAKILWDQGITFTISYHGDMEVMGSRNLPFTAGTTVAYGLQPEQAVQLITLNAAKILGIDKRLGSIEVGKDATFFISEGDALDMMTNQLTHAYIGGRAIDLSSAQTYLYEMYMDKYGLSK